MTSYARTEVIRLLEVEENFLESLEQESIVYVDVEQQRFSPRMMERIRVAHSLVFELEVNLSGVAVILRMREELGSMQGALSRAQAILRARGTSEGARSDSEGARGDSEEADEV